jgi:carboxyl-terminal processing protease
MIYADAFGISLLEIPDYHPALVSRLHRGILRTLRLKFGTVYLFLLILTLDIILRREIQMGKCYRYCIAFILILLASGSCKKDEIPTKPIEIKEASDVNKFVYKGLSSYYLWESQVFALNNPAYNNKDSLNTFLNKYKNPEELFYSLLYEHGKVDKFSIIVDNSKVLDDWLAGISESMGIDFKLYYIRSGSEDLVGVIRYVFKNSPAAGAGLKRGDFFTLIDGQQLTSSNYQTLLFTHKIYTMGLASYGVTGFYANGKTATMTAVSLVENPIHLDTILNVNGIKVGYLVYNLFSNSFDSYLNTTFDVALNNVFGEFKNGNIQKLIIDLRYNYGGSINSAIYLASMIYSANAQLIFCKTIYNTDLNNYFLTNYGQDYFNDYFQKYIAKTDKTPVTEINSLGISEVYFITSSETASASELLINGLKPYISVKQVGSNTVGKNVGSITVKDWIDSNGNVNPNHTWAMQPIVCKIANSQNFSDYTDGLVPDITAHEDVTNLLPFGDLNETMLKTCLDNIKGSKTLQIYRELELKPFKSSDDYSPVKDMMFVEKQLPLLSEIKKNH